MARIVIDTSPLISALGWKNGIPRKVFDACISGESTLIETKEQLSELVNVLKRPKFSFISEDEKRDFIVGIYQLCELVQPKEKINAVADDPSDNIHIEAAVEGKCEYIVSGDKKHLLKLKEFRGIKIVTPKEFLDILNKSRENL